MEIMFHSHANKTNFHEKSCAPSLILKVRVFGTRKWPIGRNNDPVSSATSMANRPFPSYPKPLFQSEAKCEATDIKMIFFYSHAYKTHFHKKGIALSLALKARDFGTRKWPIEYSNYIAVS